LNYKDWDADKMRAQELSIIQNARHSFFVSAALRDRATNEYGIDSPRVSVSMNATDEEFLLAVPKSEIDRLIATFPNLKRPIAGVIGGINDRLNFELLVKVADSDCIGSIVFVGSIAPGFYDAALDRLLRNLKCVFVGRQPHESLPLWSQAVDVALIPFRRSSFNTMCSPMRLFDHLATGKPIVATDACPQVSEFQNFVQVASTDGEFIGKLQLALSGATESRGLDWMTTHARERTWSARAQALQNRMELELKETK
jgi:glycosyltransferase involved in cell wall biosynthesis